MRRTLRWTAAAVALAVFGCAPPVIVRDPPAFPPVLGGGAAVAQPGPPLAAPQMLSLPVLQADLAAKAGDTVTFDRDSYALDPAARAILERQAIWLLGNPWVRASIEGHADVRQTREYALALGERRAAAVRNFLLTRGVPPEQLTIVSWGKERPAVAAAHDATFLQNSRVRTVLVLPEQGPYPPLLPPPPPPLD